MPNIPSTLIPNPSQTFIDGRWCDAADHAQFEVRNPATDETVASVPDCGPLDAERAIAAARSAGAAWRRATARQRHAILMDWLGLIRSHREELARLLTQEQGKPLREARAEVDYGASFVEWFAEEGKRAYGEIIPTTASDRRLLVSTEPIGVCAAITPWNFPIAMVTRKLAPALAAGCTVVLKPAEATPLCALALASLAERAGVQSGVINVLTADRANGVAIGRVLCESPIVRHLSFTGSTAVGKLLMRQCASTVKKLALELGGNAPFIVFDDADLDAAVEGAIASKFRNAGQTCVCTNRFYVQADVYDDFARRFGARVAALSVGDGSREDVDIGPLINRQACSKAHLHVTDAIARGAVAVVGGSPNPAGESYYTPTVLRDVASDSLVCQEETFGPVAGLVRFDTEAEVYALANDSQVGLAAYVYTRDLGRAFRASEAIEAGMVGVNTGLISNEVAPFGGIKQSGLGREGSRHGLCEYLELKYTCMAGLA